MKQCLPNDALEDYAALLEQWGKNVSIGGKRGGRQAINQRIARSLRLMSYLENYKDNFEKQNRLLDIGSGVGLPAIPLAIQAAQQTDARWQPLQFHLVESQQKRALLLKEVVRRLGIENVTIHHGRMEELPSLKADFFTAATVAPLLSLFSWMERHKRDKNAKAILLKGRGLKEELHEAEKSWIMKKEICPLKEGGVMLIIHHWDKKP